MFALFHLGMCVRQTLSGSTWVFVDIQNIALRKYLRKKGHLSWNDNTNYQYLLIPFLYFEPITNEEGMQIFLNVSKRVMVK